MGGTVIHEVGIGSEIFGVIVIVCGVPRFLVGVVGGGEDPVTSGQIVVGIDIQHAMVAGGFGPYYPLWHGGTPTKHTCIISTTWTT